VIHFELMCGMCDSHFEVDCDSDTYEDSAWLMAQRFMNAHAASCNYASPLEPQDHPEIDEPRTRVIKANPPTARRTDEDEPS
jgi:hypothetical protein